MSIIKSNSIVMKIAIGTIGVAFVFGLLLASAVPAQAALTTSQVNAIIALLQSFGADAATVANVQASLTGGTPTVPSGGSTASVCPYTWATSLTDGSTGADVLALQQFLNSDSATVLGSTGAGSPGNETSYFGSITKAGVVKFQDKYASEVLAPVGLSAGTGYFGSSSRAKANSLCAVASTPTTPGTPTTPATGTGLSIVGGVQPAATLAPDSAARVPFTTFIVTAGSDGDVVMNSVTVERTGLSADSAFASVVLLDGNGTQIGLTKTLNSNHQARVGENVTIPAGTSKSFTVAANMASDNSTRDGGTPRLDVVAINTSATVTGSLPIVGTTQTINASLTIGSVTVQRGPLDPNATATKEVGTTGYTFSSLKVTSGSTEKVRLHSVRWNQGSSTATSDLENLETIVDGVSYPLTVSADGKFYTAVFAGGILIEKGLSKEISIKGDIVSGSGRTITFTIEKKTDINLTGETFGYGITPPTSGTGISSGNIWFAASTVTVSGGSMTITQDTSVASQNIAINLANQVLGAFKVKVEGEAISVSSIVFDVATTTGAGRLTDVTFVDSNGAVVAGPVDLPATASNGGSVTFTDSVTFPIGENTYTVKGKVATGSTNDSTYKLSTVASSDWSSVTGDTTGNTITPSPSASQTFQTMTVKGASVTLSTSNTPAAQNIVAGAQNYTFANIQFDTTSSGEDVKFTTFLMNYSTDGTVANLTSCQLFNGTQALNTGSNIVNPSAVSSSTTFRFDSPLILSKGVVSTLALKCNLSSSASNNDAIYWSYAPASTPSATGQLSGESATITEPTAANSLGQKQTVQAKGTITVSLDASSPSYKLASGGTTGNIVNVLKFAGTNEAIILQRIALVLTNDATASSTAADLTQVTIWDGATQVGTAIFTAGNTVATSTMTQTVTIPKNGIKLLTIKADLADIGTGQAGVEGHLVKVDYDNSANIGTRGIGAESGSTIDRTSSSDTASSGVRVFNTFPTVTKLSVPTNSLSNGDKVLLRWKVVADSRGDVGISQFTIKIATTTASVTEVDIYAYTDSTFATPVSGLSNDGGFVVTNKLVSGNAIWSSSAIQIHIAAETTGAGSTTVQVPAGGTRYFEVRGTVAGSASGASISTQLEGDNSYPALATTFMANAAAVNGDTHDDFIWSPNATTTASVTANDWTNGYGVSGFPGTNLSAEVISQ